MEVYEHNPKNLPSTDVSRWTPVLNGDIFCSPACGSKCKLAAYEKAVKAANDLCTVLGDGWESNVWENGDWYFNVNKGDATVSRGYDGGYTASLRVDYVSESYILAIEYESDDPRLAVDGLTSKLATIIARLARAKSSASLELISIE